MVIVWDEHKRQLNLAARGLDFADLDEEFFLSATFVEAKRGRLMAISDFRGRIISVVFKPLGTEAISIVSMRPSNRKERSIR